MLTTGITIYIYEDKHSTQKIKSNQSSTSFTLLNFLPIKVAVALSIVQGFIQVKIK